MKTNPFVWFITIFVFISSVIRKTFSEDEQFETATEIEVGMGSQTQIALVCLLGFSGLATLLFHIPFVYSVLGSLLVLPWIYHVGRIAYVEHKALF